MGDVGPPCVMGIEAGDGLLGVISSHCTHILQPNRSLHAAAADAFLKAAPIHHNPDQIPNYCP